MDITWESFWYIFGFSVLPVSEVRGAIIYGLATLDQNIWNILAVYFISVVGNFLPVPFILILFRPIVKWMKKTRLFNKMAHWLEERTNRKAGKLSKISAGALMVFVAIPFPTTGAWTGSMIAALLDMRMKYALPAILGGVMIAGSIMVLLMTGVLNLGTLGEFLTTR